MARLKRPELASEARRINLEQLAGLGAEVRASRRRRHLTQAAVAGRAGVVQSTVSRLERGGGGSLALDAWQRVFLAVERRLQVTAGRDALAEPADAGHLAIQELVMRLAREAGRMRAFELATRPLDPRRSADVGIRDDRSRTLLLVECWNTIGDIGAAVRSTDRKLAEARDLAVAVGGERPYRVAGVWVVRSTSANRSLIARYPETFSARFPGSSGRWTAALVGRAAPPDQLGLVWCDRAATRVFAWRTARAVTR